MTNDDGLRSSMTELAMLSVALSLEDPAQARVVAKAANEIAALRKEIEELQARLAKLAPYEATLVAYDEAFDELEFLNAIRNGVPSTAVTADEGPTPRQQALRSMVQLDEEMGLYDDEAVPPAPKVRP